RKPRGKSLRFGSQHLSRAGVTSDAWTKFEASRNARRRRSDFEFHPGDSSRAERVDQNEFEQIVRMVTEEVVLYLGTPETVAARGASSDGEICPDCDLNCVQKCARKTRAVVEAGADRIS